MFGDILWLYVFIWINFLNNMFVYDNKEFVKG